MTTQVDILTSLVDFYNLKKEGKVSGSGNEPCLQASDKTKYEGVMPILAHLDTKLSVLGTTLLERALVKQWVTFQFSCMDSADKKEIPQPQPLVSRFAAKCKIAQRKEFDLF